MPLPKLLDELQEVAQACKFPYPLQIFLYYEWALPALKRHILKRLG